MRFTTTLAAAAALTVSGFAANAGGLNNEIMEAPVVMEEPMMAPAGSSVSPAIIVLGVLAALLVISQLDSDDEDED